MSCEQASNDPDYQRKFETVLTKAGTDDDYRQKLKDNPHAVLKEAGINVPDNIELKVRDYDFNCRYIFLPPKMEQQEAVK